MVYRQAADGKQFTVGLLGEGNVYGDVQWFGPGTQNVSIDVFEDAGSLTNSDSLDAAQSLVEVEHMKDYSGKMIQ